MYELFQFIGTSRKTGTNGSSGPIRAFGGSVQKYDEPALIALGENSRPYKPEPDLFLKFASVDAECRRRDS